MSVGDLKHRKNMSGREPAQRHGKGDGPLKDLFDVHATSIEPCTQEAVHNAIVVRWIKRWKTDS